MTAITIAITAVTAIGCAFLAKSMAEKRGRHPLRWAAATVLVGVAMVVVELFVWTRPAGDAASPAGFDMQTLLPTFAMLGTAFVMTQLPNLSQKD